jgi:hypothetical protein
VFGRNKKVKELSMKYMAQYIGGHPRHPKDFYTTVTFLPELLVIGHNYEIVIPYHTITSIENTREKKFDIDRLVSFGPGGLIKKNHIYTVVKTREVPNIIPVQNQLTLATHLLNLDLLI